jgi:hypothetical protein
MCLRAILGGLKVVQANGKKGMCARTFLQLSHCMVICETINLFSGDSSGYIKDAADYTDLNKPN